MNPKVKNILAAVAGVIIGSIVNMCIIMISGTVIPPPEGADISTTEGLKASMHLFQPKHYIMPFLAHALGTLVGAMVAAVMATNYKMRFALGVGFWFLLGGTAMVFMIPSPTWFNVLDLGLAYLPMAYIGGKMVSKR